MGLTLNQIISRLKTLALSHQQVNSFYFGDPWEFDTNGEITYPACFLEQRPGVIDRVEKLQTFAFRIYFLELVGVSTATEESETEVLSDMSSIAADYLGLLMAPAIQQDWIISKVNPLTSVTETLGDMAAGVVMDIEVSVEFLADSCQVPASDTSFGDGGLLLIQTGKRPRILTYTALGVEGETFVVTGIADKFVLAAWRAGYYKRISTSTPDSEMLKVAGTAGTGGITATGTVSLPPGDLLIENEKLDFLYYA